MNHLKKIGLIFILIAISESLAYLFLALCSWDIKWIFDASRWETTMFAILSFSIAYSAMYFVYKEMED